MADTEKSTNRGNRRVSVPDGANEGKAQAHDVDSGDAQDVQSDVADDISSMMSAVADGIESDVDKMADVDDEAGTVLVEDAVPPETKGGTQEDAEQASDVASDGKGSGRFDGDAETEDDVTETDASSSDDVPADGIMDADAFASSVRERLRRIDEIGNAAMERVRSTRLPADANGTDGPDDAYKTISEDDDLSIVEAILEKSADVEDDHAYADASGKMKPADDAKADASQADVDGQAANGDRVSDGAGNVSVEQAAGERPSQNTDKASADDAPTGGIIGHVSPMTVDDDFDTDAVTDISASSDTFAGAFPDAGRTDGPDANPITVGIGENGVNTTKRLAFRGSGMETIPHDARDDTGPDGTTVMSPERMADMAAGTTQREPEAAGSSHITPGTTRRADDMPNEDSKRDVNPFADDTAADSISDRGNDSPVADKTERMPRATAASSDPFSDPARVITPAQGMKAASIDASQVGGRGNARRRAGRKHGKYFAAKVAAAIAVPVLAVGIGYGVGVNHYTTHLLPNTELDGVQIGGMTADEAKAATTMDGWTLTLEDGKDGDKTTVTPDQIGLKTDGATVDDLLSKQDAWMWPLDMSRANASEERHVEFDEDKLRQVIADLPAVKGEGREQATDAKVRYDESSQRYVVDAEKAGNVVDADKLYDKVSKAIGSVKPVTVDYEDDSLYVQPNVTKDDQALNDSASSANKMLQTSVTYNIDGVKDALTVNSDQIKDWVTIGDDGKAVLDEAKVKEYLGKVGKEWDTVGTTRSFTTPDGRQKTVSGGDYGWVTDEGTELTKLVSDIKAGNTITRDFATKKKAAGAKGTNEWGDTYLEADLSTQQMWYVKGGQVVANFPVITGKNGSDTPTGVFTITRKQTNQVLLGEIDPSTGKREYETPVAKWMPTSYGSGNSVGFHSSSSWRSTSLFYTNGEGSTFTSAASRNAVRAWNGSHGCLNMTDADADALYSLISAGDPVIIHN